MALLHERYPLPDIAGDEPAGENLEFDPAFIELDRLARGKPEQQYGSTIVPAEEPDWKEVTIAARELMERCYDLRVAALLGVARLQREGLPGFADTLGMVRELVETRWSQVHPQLDPEDDNDPTLRANALLKLAEPGRVIRVLRQLPLARSSRAGSVSWRDIAIADGTLEVDEEAPRLSMSVIDGAFREADPSQLTALHRALEEATAHAAAIPQAFNENAGYGTGPDFSDLAKLLQEMIHMMDRHAAASEQGPEEEPAADDDTPSMEVTAAAPSRSRPAVSIATLGPPTNRKDATRLLDLVIAYYEEHEPSSPLPLLIARARRMAEMNFMDILRDMAPDALSQAEMVTGRQAED